MTRLSFFMKSDEMKTKNLLLIILFVCSLAACRHNEKKSTDIQIPVTESTMYLTAKDTMAVMYLMDRFMGLVKEQQYDTASMLLRKIAVVERSSRPIPLKREEAAKIAAMLKQFPVQDYEIEHIIFKKADNNEVKCRIRSGQTTINWYFKPVRYIGRWSLCLKGFGDTSIIN